MTIAAVLSPWEALHSEGALQAGELLVVVGADGLGLNGVQAGQQGWRPVAAVAPLPEHPCRALKLGAEIAVSPDQVGDVMDWSSGGRTSLLRPSGKGPGSTARQEGWRRVVCRGYAMGVEYRVDSGRLVLEELTSKGSRPLRAWRSQRSTREP
jgi:hypothetical protein